MFQPGPFVHQMAPLCGWASSERGSKASESKDKTSTATFFFHCKRAKRSVQRGGTKLNVWKAAGTLNSVTVCLFVWQQTLALQVRCFKSFLDLSLSTRASPQGGHTACHSPGNLLPAWLEVQLYQIAFLCPAGKQHGLNTWERWGKDGRKGIKKERNLSFVVGVPGPEWGEMKMEVGLDRGWEEMRRNAGLI